MEKKGEGEKKHSVFPFIVLSGFYAFSAITEATADLVFCQPRILLA